MALVDQNRHVHYVLVTSFQEEVDSPRELQSLPKAVSCGEVVIAVNKRSYDLFSQEEKKELESKEKSHVEITTFIYPLDKLQPLLYEGQNLQKWFHRNRLISIATSTTSIFSLSIVPRDPKVKQLIYFKRFYTLDRFKCTSKRNQTSNQHSKVNEKILRGCLKPSPHFDSDLVKPDIDFYEKNQSYEYFYLSSEEDIKDCVQDIQPRHLQIKVHIMALHFLKDENASQMALITVQPLATPLQPIKKKIFVKV